MSLTVGSHFVNSSVSALQDLIGLLADRGKAILNPSDLFGDPVEIHVGADRANFFWIVLSFRRPTPHDRCDPLDFLVANQPVGDIDHHIAGADYRHVLAHVERPVAETGQSIEMVDHIFRVKDPLSRIPFHADGLGALRADRKHDRAGAKVSDLFDGEIFAVAD